VFVSFNKAKLIAVQSIKQAIVLQWPKCHCLCKVH